MCGLKIQLPVHVLNNAEQALIKERDVAIINQPGFALREFLDKLRESVTDFTHTFGREKNEPE